MIRVWILLLVCIFLAHCFERSIVKNDGLIEKRSETKTSLFFFTVLVIVLVLFAGLRTVMNDTLTYASSFSVEYKVPSGWRTIFNVDWTIGSNPLFNVYQRVLKTIFGSNPQILIFVSSLIIEFSYLMFLKKYSTDFKWSVFTLLAFTFYAFSMAAMKQSLSIAIGIWFIPTFIDKKYLKAIIILIIACLFHPYVLILGVLPFFQNNVWQKKTLLFVVGTAIVAFAFNYFVDVVMDVSYIFGEDYKIEYFTGEGVGIARIVSYLAIPVVTFFARKEINNLNNPLVNVSVNATILSGCIMIIAGMGGSVMLGRVPSYLDLFTCITVPIVFSVCKYKNREVYKFAFICLMLIFYYTYYYKYHINYCGGNWFGDIYQHTKFFSLFH